MEKSAIRQGWDFMAEILGANTSAESAFQDFSYETSTNNQIRINNINIAQQNAAIEAHVNAVNEQIDLLTDSINNHPHKGNTIGTFKGFVAEEWHAGTFNIDAIKNDSTNRAWTLQSNSDGSVDIETNFGKSYSLKYYNDASNAENAQAALFKDSHEIKYHNQERLIADEQIEDAKYWAGRREIQNKYNSNKDSEISKNLSKAHRETAQHLVGKVSDGDGIESKTLSIKESEQIAKEAQKGKFDPEKHGIKKEVAEYIDYENEIKINYVENALKAGLTAASITAITQLVPELYKAIDYLIKNGEIDIQQLKNSGQKIITASGESFLRGSIAYGLELAIQEGLLGEAIQSVSPTIIGSMVTVVLGTIKNSILVAAGKMTAKQMGAQFIDSVVISAGYIAAMKVGGLIAQAIAPELPGLAYAIGSLIGCTIAVVYNIGKKKFISFCVNTGFTCFGLVEQNYELPESVLDEMGIKTASVTRTQVARTGVEVVNPLQNVEKSNYETVEMTMVKRGVIGINKIGYVI